MEGDRRLRTAVLFRLRLIVCICSRMWLLAALLLSAAAPSSGQESQGSSPMFRPENFLEPIEPHWYLVRPGDRLSVSFLRTQLPPLQLQVDGEGRIVHEQLGVIDVQFQSLADVREQLLGRLGRVFSAPQIDIAISSPYVTNVRVSGAVVHPGRHRVWNADSWQAVIDSAGGRTSSASSRWLNVVTTAGQIRIDRSRPGENPVPSYAYAVREIIVPPAGAHTALLLDGSGKIRRLEFLSGERAVDLLRIAEIDSSLFQLIRRTGAWRTIVQADDLIASGGLYQAIAADQSPTSIVCGGAVRRPVPARDWPAETTIADLLAANGGLDPAANEDRLLLIRHLVPGEVLSGGIARLVLNPPAAEWPTTPLLAGDSLFVPYRTGAVSVSGSVQQVGLIPWEQSMTAQEAVSRSGGLTIEASRAEWRYRRSGSSDLLIISPGGRLSDGDQLIIREKADDRAR